MIMSFRERHPEFFEVSTRYCPICDKFIRMGQSIHKCSKKTLEKIEKEKGKKKKENRTFDEKLKEAEDFFNSN